MLFVTLSRDEHTKCVQYVCDEHKLAWVELDDRHISQQLGTLQNKGWHTSQRSTSAWKNVIEFSLAQIYVYICYITQKETNCRYRSVLSFTSPETDLYGNLEGLHTLVLLPGHYEGIVQLFYPMDILLLTQVKHLLHGTLDQRFESLGK